MHEEGNVHCENQLRLLTQEQAKACYRWGVSHHHLTFGRNSNADRGLESL